MSYYLVTEFRTPRTMGCSYIGEFTQHFNSFESAVEKLGPPYDPVEQAVKATLERELEIDIYSYRYIRHADR